MYFVGIDGGGTNTRACVLDEKGQVLGIGKSGPSSIDTVDIETTLRHIKEAILEVFNKNYITSYQVQSIFIGIGGVLTEASKEYMKKQIRSLDFISDDTIITAENDVYNALLGGNETRPGICLIAGTGSVAFGMDELGKTHRAGGYGHQEGDLGSSFDLGRKTILHISHVFDKRNKETAFSRYVMNHLKINEVGDLLHFIMSYYEDRTLTASLAPIVTKYADLGDEVARGFCDHATDELALDIKAVYENIKLENKEIAIIGSLGNSQGYFHDQLISKIKKIADFKIHGPLIEPVVGSAIQALNIWKNHQK